MLPPQTGWKRISEHKKSAGIRKWLSKRVRGLPDASIPHEFCDPTKWDVDDVGEWLMSREFVSFEGFAQEPGLFFAVSRAAGSTPRPHSLNPKGRGTLQT